jgi:hypothetical protein
MKHRPISKKRAVLISTLLIAVAIPATVLGTQKIQDIRNQAAEEETPIDFTTDFASDSITKAYEGVPYSKTVTLSGYNAKNATLYLGCDPEKCGTLCNLELHNPPYGLKIGLDSRTIIWENPQATNGRDSWDITLTAVAPDTEDKQQFNCAIQRYTLDLAEKTRNEKPTCSLESVKYNLSAIPQNYNQSFILKGEDIDGGISSAKVELISSDGETRSKTWEFSNDSMILINKDSNPALTFDMSDLGSYTVEAYVTDSDGVEVECEQRRDIKMVVTVPGDQDSPEFLTDPYQDASPSASIDIGQSYRYEAEAIDPNDDEMDYFIINDTGWLNFTVTENEPGSFKGLFAGTPSEKGSYTVVLSLSDGYHDHYSTQIWVVDVGQYGNVEDIEQPDEDDIPDLDSYPQILNVKPLEKAETEDTEPLISASLKASDGSTIKEGSINIDIDDTDVTEESQIRGEGKSTGSVTFIPEQPLHKGTHRITISFTDSSGSKAEKSWTFTIKSEEDAIPVPEEQDGIEILGYVISKRMAIVLLIGMGLIALAIAIPWIMYTLWKRTDKGDAKKRPSGYMLPTEAEIPPEPKIGGPAQSVMPSQEPGTFEGFDVKPTESVDDKYISAYEKPPEAVPQTEPLQIAETEAPSEGQFIDSQTPAQETGQPQPEKQPTEEPEQAPPPETSVPTEPQELKPEEEVKVDNSNE